MTSSEYQHGLLIVLPDDARGCCFADFFPYEDTSVNGVKCILKLQELGYPQTLVEVVTFERLLEIIDEINGQILPIIACGLSLEQSDILTKYQNVINHLPD